MTTPLTTDEIQARVRALYQENLHRDADVSGLAFYTTKALNGVTFDQIDTMMEASPEYAALNGVTGDGPVAGNARLWVIGGAVLLLIVIVARRAKK